MAVRCQTKGYGLEYHLKARWHLHVVMLALKETPPGGCTPGRVLEGCSGGDALFPQRCHLHRGFAPRRLKTTVYQGSVSRWVIFANWHR